MNRRFDNVNIGVSYMGFMKLLNAFLHPKPRSPESKKQLNRIMGGPRPWQSPDPTPKAWKKRHREKQRKDGERAIILKKIRGEL